MANKELEYNQEGIEPEQFLYYPNGQKKAKLVHIMKSGDCGSCYEKDSMNFTDGLNVYRRIWHTG